MLGSLVQKGWASVLQQIRPFGDTDFTAVLVAVGNMVGAEAGWIVSEGELVAVVGSVEDVDPLLLRTLAEAKSDSAVIADLGSMHFVRGSLPTTSGHVAFGSARQNFDQGTIDIVAAIGNVIDLALAAKNRRNSPSTAIQQVSGQTDKLTGALLRDDFRALLDAEIESEVHSATVIVLGVDGTSIVNDTLGYATGDQLLQTVASRLLTTVRSCDVVARLSGDVFGIYCPGIGSDLAEDVANRIQRTIGAAIDIDDGTMTVTISAGIASLTASDSAAELLSNADLALQAAKSRGSGAAEQFDDDLAEQVSKRRHLATEFQTALDANQLTTALEPIIGMPDGKVVGLEARVRWLHPTRGLIDRDEFMGMAETIGRVADVERAIIHLAARNWDGQETGVRTSVNLSGSSLRDERQIEWLLERIPKQGAHNDLIVEVSEEAMRLGGSMAVDHLETLRDCGVGITLDDFGTDLASLRTLHMFAFDGVKLHQDLVTSDQIQSQSIVKAVYAVGEVLGFDVIHTGIDSERDLLTLTRLDRTLQLGGFYAQGRAVRHHAAAQLG